ncbi:arginine--tRNA ligase [candidate division KSB1 bacterium]|nr:arginine--tRNA ligase [candidate division KSB1 bacterium]
MKIENYLTKILNDALTHLNYGEANIDIYLERPKLEAHGDFSSNVAMLLPAFAKKAPRKIAEEIVEALSYDPNIIEKVEIAGPGFINFFLGMGYYQSSVKDILDAGIEFGNSDWGAGRKIQVEFVSANPTGPLNVVSARAAAVGDVMVNLFNAVGFKGYREFYVNDAGRQIRLLGESVSARYMELLDKKEDLPEEGYHGEYVKDIAREIIEQDGDKYVRLPIGDRQEQMGQIALTKMLESQREMMDLYGVNFDNWYHESELRKQNAQEQVLQDLKEKGYIFEEEGAVWFKSTEFGDDKDRVLVTQDGNPTYFLIDIAYHKTKYDRGFEKLYDLWGPDHHGYIARMSAAIQAMGYPGDSFQVEIIQQVNLLRSGEVIKMSKRAGKIIEMQEVIEEVGVDAARFFFVNRKITSHLDFDIDLAKKQSDENPVYYLQYAHARICSILNFAHEKGVDPDEDARLDLLKEPEEKNLIAALLQLPDTISKAATSLDIHILPNYLHDVASVFHRFYHYHKVVSDDVELSKARLALVKATQIVLANGFGILGITAPERM